ncbi:MAG: hypothetical protein AAEC10_04560 [Rhodospirillales bacterium]
MDWRVLAFAIGLVAFGIVVRLRYECSHGPLKAHFETKTRLRLNSLAKAVFYAAVVLWFVAPDYYSDNLTDAFKNLLAPAEDTVSKAGQ